MHDGDDNHLDAEEGVGDTDSEGGIGDVGSWAGWPSLTGEVGDDELTKMSDLLYTIRRLNVLFGDRRGKL